MESQERTGFLGGAFRRTAGLLRGPLGYAAARFRDFFQGSQTTSLVALALVIGAGAGLGAVLFRLMIASAEKLFFSAAHAVFGFAGSFHVVAAPAMGGLLVGLLVYYLAREAKGHGVPEVMEAVAERGGRIRGRVAVIKSLASAICIGSGGSAGREGPIVQIGSSLGSTLGQVLGLNEERVKLLVACGAAGGIAATFNAPIAGAIFALEVILRTFASRSFGAVVLAAVAAATVSHPFLGNEPAFKSPLYELRSAKELPLYLLLGILAALIAQLYTRLIYLAEDLTEQLRGWDPAKTLAGGAMVGLMGAWIPQVFGVGYATIDLALAGKAAAGLMAILVFGKILATAITLGSGGSGGIFAPALFIGGCLGYVFGHGVHSLFPSFTAGPGAYALVGMGAVFSGAARAPITAILIIFEMTGDYSVILPMMTAIVISTLISEHLSKGDIYTTKLLRRGVDLARSRAMDTLDNITVGRAMTRDFDTVDVDMPLGELTAKFLETGHHGFPVTVGDNRLWGIVTLKDVENVSEDDVEKLTVRDVATSPALTVRPEQSLHDAINQFGVGNVGRLPVVDRSDPDRLIGVLRRSDIIEAYAANLRMKEKRPRIAGLSLDVESPGISPLTLTVTSESPWVGRRVSDLGVSKDALIVSVERGGYAILPRGDTVLEAGDRLTLVAECPTCVKIREDWERWAAEHAADRQPLPERTD